MTRILTAIFVLVVGLRLSAQDAWPSDRLPQNLDPVVQAGTYLDQQRDRPMSFSGTGTDTLVIQNLQQPGHTFTAEPGFPGQYSVRENFNPMASYTVNLQPSGGFTIRDDLAVAPITYTVNREPFGGYTVQNQQNPSENYAVRSQRPDGFTIQRVG